MCSRDLSYLKRIVLAASAGKAQIPWTSLVPKLGFQNITSLEGKKYFHSVCLLLTFGGWFNKLPVLHSYYDNMMASFFVCFEQSEQQNSIKPVHHDHLVAKATVVTFQNFCIFQYIVNVFRHLGWKEQIKTKLGLLWEDWLQVWGRNGAGWPGNILSSQKARMSPRTFLGTGCGRAGTTEASLRVGTVMAQNTSIMLKPLRS